MSKANLEKPSLRGKRNCEFCATEYAVDHERCRRCERNPEITMRWHPNEEVAEFIVLHYVKTVGLISSDMIADHIEVEEDVISAAVKRLAESGEIQIQTSISITGKTKK